MYYIGFSSAMGQRAPPATRAPSTVGTSSPLPWLSSVASGAASTATDRFNDSESDLGIESMDGTTGRGLHDGSDIDWEFDFSFNDFRDR